jgi:DNA-binding NtrC family response regulator
MSETIRDCMPSAVTGNRMPELVETTRVLLVDDDPTFLSRAQKALKYDIRVRSMQNGTDALEALELWSPNVVVFDLLLEDLDGFTFLEKVSGISVARRPFVLYTTDGRGADTRVRPLPNWHVGTLIRSAPAHQLREAVLQAARCQDPEFQRQITA